MSVLARARAAATIERPLRPAWFVVGVILLLLATAGAAAAPETAAARWLLSMCAAAALVFVCLRSTRQGIVVTLLWLIALGASRRLASEVLADPGRDPFVLVGVSAATVLTVRAVLVGAWQRLTPLAWAVLAFTGLAVLQLVNPEQAGLGRFAGLLVWVAPLLWFWIGRTLLDSDLARRVILGVVGTATVVALYGILQSTLDFPSWDQRWIEHRGYAALFVGPETVRPFGSYASAAEFALACAVGAVIAATAVFASRRLLASGPSDDRRRVPRRIRTRIVVLGAAVFAVNALGLALSAIRTYLVLLVIALPVVYLVMRGRRGWKVVGVVGLCAAVVVGSLAQVDPDSVGRTGPQASIRRILVVVNDPFTSNEENTDNTLELHYENVKQGLSDAFSDPLGRGTGATGIAGEHFGDTSTSTDVDVVDAGIAFGLFGLVLALGIIGLGMATAFRVARASKGFLDATLVGILVVSLGAWFQGAHYAMAPVLWLLLGRADGTLARSPRRSEAARAQIADPSSVP